MRPRKTGVPVRAGGGALHAALPRALHVAMQGGDCWPTKHDTCAMPPCEMHMAQQALLSAALPRLTSFSVMQMAKYSSAEGRRRAGHTAYCLVKFFSPPGSCNSRLYSAGLPSAVDPGLAPPMAVRAESMTQMRCGWRASLMALGPIQLASIVSRTETDDPQAGKDHANVWPYPCSSFA